MLQSYVNSYNSIVGVENILRGLVVYSVVGFCGPYHLEPGWRTEIGESIPFSTAFLDFS